MRVDDVTSDIYQAPPRSPPRPVGVRRESTRLKSFSCRCCRIFFRSCGVIFGGSELSSSFGLFSCSNRIRSLM